jgi:hypothetical protein
MTLKRVPFLPIIAATSVIAALAFWLIQSEPSADGTRPATPTNGDGQKGPSKASSKVGANSNLPPERTSTSKSGNPTIAARALPARDTPLVSIYEELKAMSAAGNYRAACRLSAEMNRCRTLDINRGVFEADKAELSKLKPGTPQYMSQERLVSQSEANYQRDLKVCNGFPQAETKEAWRHLLTAAEAGHVPSMTRFALSPPLEEQQFTTELDAWQTYRQVAPRLLESAVGKGDPAALYAYAAYLEGKLPAPGGPLYQRDPVKSYAMTTVLLQITDEASKPGLHKRLGRLASEIGPVGTMRAESEASSMALRFAGKKDVSFSGGLTLGDHPSECQE